MAGTAARALPPARRTKVANSRKPLLSVEYRSDRVAWRCDVRDSLLGVEHWAYGVKRVRFLCLLKFIYFEKAAKFWEIFTLILTVCTVVKGKRKMSQNFMALCLFVFTEVTQVCILAGSIWGNLAKPLYYIFLTSRQAMSSQNASLIQLQIFDQAKQ